MDHPNIASVLDAGATDSGRPYFVMELVRGIPITAYCDRQRLGTRERLQLFVNVCQAVQHAHQKGVIHRDLKPSNVLVTEHDGTPVPKVIDFGVAKAINQQLTEKTLFTRFQQMVGTPMYMSPEQADLSGLDVDTRTDIYSLGVLLYELLTGTTPFDKQRFSEVAYDEIRRVIREEEPPKPSTRISSLRHTAITISGCRRTDPKRLSQLMRGELDWVIMKAMDKDRTGRYVTANDMALDIRRHLNSEPVMARPPSAGYRLSRYVRRNATALATAAAISFALLVGTSISVWQAVQATRNARAANEAKSRSEANRLLAEQNLSAAQSNLYASDMLLAQQALSGSNRGRAQRLLERHRPSDGAKDLRGWEWDFLWQQCQSDALFQLGTLSDSIKSVHFGPDPRLVLTADAAGQAILWDLERRERVTTFEADGYCVDARLSQDGRHVATAVFNIKDHSGKVRVWEMASKTQIVEIPYKKWPQAVAFAPNNEELAILVLGLGTVQIIDLNTLHVDRSLPVSQWSGSSTHYGAMEFSSSGERLAVGEASGTVRILDPGEGTQMASIPAHSGPVMALAFSPDGKWIATSSGFASKAVKVWSMRTREEVAELSGHDAWVPSLSFSKDGRFLVLASADQTLRIWGTGDWAITQTLEGHVLEVWAAAFSPDGRYLVSGSKDGSILLWDPALQVRDKHRTQFVDGIQDFVFLADSRELMVRNDNGEYLQFLFGPNENKTKDIDHAVIPSSSLYPSIAAAPSGRFAAFVSEKDIVQVIDRGTRNGSGQAVASVRGSYVLRFTSDDAYLATVVPGEAIFLWSSHSWDLARSVPSDEDYYSADVSSDGVHFAIGDHWGKLRFGLVDAPEESYVRQAGSGTIADCEFSPDSRWIAACGSGGETTVWEVSTGKEVARFRGHLLGTTGLTFSPDGRRLITASTEPHALKVWDTTNWQQLLNLNSPGRFHTVRFSTDGKRVGALNTDGRLYLWSTVK